MPLGQNKAEVCDKVRIGEVPTAEHRVGRGVVVPWQVLNAVRHPMVAEPEGMLALQSFQDPLRGGGLPVFPLCHGSVITPVVRMGEAWNPGRPMVYLEYANVEFNPPHGSITTGVVPGD